MKLPVSLDYPAHAGEERRAATAEQAATDCGNGTPGTQQFGGDNEISEKMVLLHRPLVAEPGQDGTRRPQPRNKPNARPETLHRLSAKRPEPSLFVVHAYSLEQARALVAAKLADKTGVLIVAPSRDVAVIPDTRGGLPRDGLRLSDAKVDPSRAGARGDGIRRRTHAHVQSLPLDGLQ